MQNLQLKTTVLSRVFDENGMVIRNISIEFIEKLSKFSLSFIMKKSSTDLSYLF